MLKTKVEVDAFLENLDYPYISPIVKRDKSSIADNGIIAQRDIIIGEIVAINYGTLIDIQTFEAITKYYDYDNALCVWFGKYLANKPFSTDGQWAYINHSCEPNIGLLSADTLIAIKPIKAGEECCIDYGTFETREGWTMECKCKSKKCRKTIAANDYLLPDLQKKLGKRYSPYLKTLLLGNN